MEKLLEDSLGCGNDATLNLHTIIVTSITAAIQHGILDIIRDSESSSSPTSSEPALQDEASSTTLRSLTCTFTVMEQGANAPLISHT